MRINSFQLTKKHAEAAEAFAKRGAAALRAASSAAVAAVALFGVWGLAVFVFYFILGVD